MKQNKFIIVTTSWNVRDWLPINLSTMMFQSYKNWQCIFIDDHSTDGSFEFAAEFTKHDERFTVMRTRSARTGQGGATLAALEKGVELNDDDIIVEVDGDDWLSSVFVLEYLNQIYQNPDIWMTHGQYQMYPTGQVGGHWNAAINSEVDENNLHRVNPFPYSHLKSYKAWLYKKIRKEDLIDPKTQEIWKSAWDHALCIPMVEMAGKKHVHKCDDILYVLNRSDELQNEGKTRTNEQKECESRIRQMPKYDKVERPKITFDLKGPGAPGGLHNFGLGNILFQVATGISLAKDNDATLVLNQLNLDNFGGYHKNILSGIYTHDSNSYTGRYVQPDFSYSEIPFLANHIYDGYFQSEKFFAHNRKEILNIIKPDLLSEKYISENYGSEFLNCTTVSVHVRRGDYVNLNHIHPVQDENYYKKALENFSMSEKFVIFSDDIEWCKQCGWFDNLPNKLFVENEKDYIDLFLMSKCNHNIIANSTFSWWGAWLNKNEDKKVVAPSNWFGPQKQLSSKDIVPENWILI